MESVNQVPNSGGWRSLWNVSTLLMAGLVAGFAFQQYVIVHLDKPYDAYLALSGYGMKSGHYWELFTYQFFHSFGSLFSGSVHLLLNLLGLWFLGRKMEQCLGVRRFLLVYFGAVVAGAVVQGGVAWTGFLLPESMESVAGFMRDRYGDSVAGSSVGLCGVFAASCRLQPRERTRLLFWIPLQRAALLMVVFGIAIVLVVVPTDPRLAHLAHLSGLVAGLVLGGRRNCIS